MQGESDIRQTEVDGVATVWCDTDDPPLAMLMFRVGRCDETMPASGITHLVEHLTLYPVGRERLVPTFNGHVDMSHAGFLVQGAPDEVVVFLRAVCSGLRSLPEERFDVERDVLVSEASGHGGDVIRSLLRWRYGSRSYGVPGYWEMGLHGLTLAGAQAWADERFVRDNAVLVLNREPPADLALDLASGPWRDCPAPTDALHGTPARYEEGSTGSAMLTRVRRSPGMPALRHVLQAAAVDDLRYERGASYSPSVSYDPLSRGEAHLSLLADAVEGRSGEVAERVLGYLDAIAAGAVSASALEEWREQTRQRWAAPGARTGRTVNFATEVLWHGDTFTYEQLLDLVDEVTSDDVAAAAQEARSGALYRLPVGAPTAGQDVQVAPLWSQAQAHGVELMGVRGNAGAVLRVSGAGVTRSFGGDRRVTVLFEEATAVLSSPNGGRTLFGADGFVVDIEAQDWYGGDQVARVVDANVDPAIVVHVPDPPPRPAGPRAREPLRQWSVVGLLVALALAGAVVSALTLPPLAFMVVAVCGYPLQAAWRALRRERAVRGLGGHPRPPLPLLDAGWATTMGQAGRMTTGPDDLDDLDVLKELGDADELDDLDDEDEGEDLLDHPEDLVSLDDRPAPGPDESVLAQDEVLDLFAEDEDALGTETGGFGPDRPRDA